MNLPIMESQRPVEVKRLCDGCTACCDTLVIVEINKPFGKKCPHSIHGKNSGCSIYDTCPTECKDYQCGWTMGAGLERDRPDISGIIVDRREGQYYGFEAREGAARTLRGMETLMRMAQVVGQPINLVLPVQIS